MSREVPVLRAENDGSPCDYCFNQAKRRVAFGGTVRRACGFHIKRMTDAVNAQRAAR